MHHVRSRIESLVRNNAKHRRGFRLQEINDQFVLKQTAFELIELIQEPDNPQEMADVFGCLIHYCVRKNWSFDEIERLLFAKLKERFTFGDDEPDGKAAAAP
jgi:hypothetical protein